MKLLDKNGLSHYTTKAKEELNKKENNSNKVTSIDENSTDTQYPSAKCMYDLIGNVETLLEVLDIGSGARELE